VGKGPLLVAEADESDRSFLLLRPQVAVVTNIDQEHLESYRDFDGLVEAFERFAESVPSTGAAVLCLDDPQLRAIAGRTVARVVTYGLDEPSASLGARDLNLEGYGSSATIVRRTAGGEAVLGTLSLGVPGRHNVANALAAIGVALELHVPFERASAALAQFRGAERRFERKGEAGGVVVIDDYGHHPTEIRAVLEAARATGAQRIVCVFQPHRYTRTAHLLDQFGPALALADQIVLTDIYPAGEDPIPGVTIERLAEAVEQSAPGRVRVVKGLADLPSDVASLARAGDMVITLGAGSINTIGPRILEEIRACRP
jgi:UDP-N-acetylmuramate--alanine ligase